MLLTNPVPLSVRRTWEVPHLLITSSRKAFFILISVDDFSCVHSIIILVNKS